KLKLDVMKQAPPSASGKLAVLSVDMRLKGGAMNTIYIGVDFHARQQTICYLTTEDGAVLTSELKHQDKEEVRAFYAQFSGRVIVGLEASGYSPWFEQMLEKLGCEVWLGDATEIRRRARWRQKNDRRDAELILDLMVHDEFPRLYRPEPQSREILRMLRYRQKLIKIRTMGKNSLQALALQSGLAKRSYLFTKAGQQELRTAPMSPVMQWQRDQWWQLLEPLNERLLETMFWLKQQTKDDERISRLRTHPGIGLLTSLCVVHTLGPVSRFRNQRKVAAYAGFDPMERSSAERKHFLGISKAGSRVLRYLLVEAAHTAVKKDDDLKRFYQRLVERRGKPKAKVAAARKLLIRSYIMLRDEIDYAEFRRRAVAARLARQSSRPPVPVA
ncbi:MAG: IS110 family transposase, partial [Acidobacteria bacterium]|nr:IS110 family transposase [Acidobacteriota bacterium]